MKIYDDSVGSESYAGIDSKVQKRVLLSSDDFAAAKNVNHLYS
jgi:hypothetical protein